MVKVQIRELKRFMADCLRAVGAKVQPATEQAELLTHAEVTGIRHFGLKNLYMYIEEINNGVCKPNNEPLILKERTSVAWVDAKHVMGATAGNFAMELAIKKAIDTGVGWVAVNARHNAEPHNYWSQKATNNGLIGVVFSHNNSSITQTSTKSKQMERKLQDTKQKKIVIKKVNQSQKRRATSGKRDIELAFTSLISSNINSTMPELKDKMDLSTNTSSDKNVDQKSSWLHEPLVQNLGQCFVAVNPACFALGFDSQLFKTIPDWNQMDLMNPNPLEVPLSDLQSKIASEVREADMLDYELEQINGIIELAVKLNVKPMHLHDTNKN